MTGHLAIQPRLSPAVLDAELRGELSTRTSGMATGNPTLRELEVLLAIIDHGTNKEVGAVLGISEQTVKNHVACLMKRNHANHRTHLIWLFWPILRDAYPSLRRGPVERRLGYERRRDDQLRTSDQPRGGSANTGGIPSRGDGPDLPASSPRAVA